MEYWRAGNSVPDSISLTCDWMVIIDSFVETGGQKDIDDFLIFFGCLSNDVLLNLTCFDFRFGRPFVFKPSLNVMALKRECVEDVSVSIDAKLVFDCVWISFDADAKFVEAGGRCSILLGAKDVGSLLIDSANVSVTKLSLEGDAPTMSSLMMDTSSEADSRL